MNWSRHRSLKGQHNGVRKIEMTNSRMALAIGLAAVSLVLALTNAIGGVAVVAAGLAPVFGISTVVAAVAAFIVSWKQRSFVVAGLLVATGIVFMIPAVIATGYFAFIMFPGPIIGVFLGVIIFGLGVAKGITTARAATAVPR
jgi:hypothetical protein